MLGFYDRIQSIREHYLDMVANEVSKYDNILIYGAGRVAKPIYRRLRKENIKMFSFAVSDKKINEEMFFDLPVMEIQDIHLDPERTIFIIAVKIVWADEVLMKIKEAGYKNYISS